MADSDRPDAKGRRLARIVGHLAANPGPSRLAIEVHATAAGRATVRIGDVSAEIEPVPAGCETLVPSGYLDPAGETQDVLRILRFLMQKDTLGQDAYLIGPPGSQRRELIFKYCELVQRPVEYVSLSQDTTESDLKQRREISQGTARYVDCAAVRAATMGSVLVLDGIEKAERNVMPLLNNLLENREMALEDGRFLVHPKRYDALREEHSEEELRTWKLVRTSHRFRVVALGLPVPRYAGSALDPPFRSRFQARDVPNARPSDQLAVIEAQVSDATDPNVPRQLVQACAVLHDLRHADGVSPMNAVPEFPQGYEQVAAELLSNYALISPRAIVDFVYPFPSLLEGSGDDRNSVVRKVLHRFALQRRPTYLPPATQQEEREKGAMVVFRNGVPPADQLVDEMSDALDGAPLCNYVVDQVVQQGASHEVLVRFRLEALSAYTFEYLRDMSYGQTVISVPAGELAPTNSVPGFVETMTNLEQFSKMVQAHSVGDFCLVGEKGGGKSALVHYFARRLGYQVEHIPLYKDITARSLLQRRITHPNGDTDWENSSLVVAALHGRVAVLDGVEQMIAGTLASLQLLVCQREARLPDGRRLVARDVFNRLCAALSLSSKQLIERGVLPIHPAFRIIALARPNGVKGGGSPTGTWRDWLGAEIQSMFRFVFVEPLLVDEQKFILRTLAPRVHVRQLEALMDFAARLRDEVARDDMLSALLTAVSLRSMIRICRRVSVGIAVGREVEEDEDDPVEPEIAALHEAIMRAALSRFLPPLVLETLQHILHASGIEPALAATREAPDHLTIEVFEGPEAAALRRSSNAIGVVRIGAMAVDVFPPKDVLLIPDILFYDNPRQSASMREMIKDWMSGQHLLLIGNQGVGKNKLADRMLQLLKLPREYIQLHRDTTVQNLTSNPTIVNGVLKYEDSPLVRAAREGRVLVVDEADKAPTHVTAILKALVEDRSMLLSDGRRIVDPDEVIPGQEAQCIPLHPEFRLIALANRPGFPFHGNDFFREVGDVFACHAIDNPDANSEMFLLRQYGPDVPQDTLRKLVAAFDELRSMSDDGQLSYPYSTRELTAIIKHMQAFPDDGVDRILRNVFDFDNYSHEEKQLLMDVFAKNGIPFSIGASSFHVSTGRTRALPPPRLIESWALAPPSEAVARGLPGPRTLVSTVKATSFPLTKALRRNENTKDYLWPLKAPHSEATLQRNERSSTVFTEELYSFTLPQGLVLGLTALDEGALVAAVRSHSLMLFQVDAEHSRCVVHDLHSAIPSDGMYRVAPNSAHVLAMSRTASAISPSKPSFDVLVQNPENGNMLALDLRSGRFAFLDLAPGCERKGPKIQVVQCPAPARDRFLLFQRGRAYVTVVDFGSNQVFTTSVVDKDPVKQLLPLPVEHVDALTGNSWLLTASGVDDARLDTFQLTLDVGEGVFRVDRIARREPTAEAAATATLPAFASGSSLAEPPGALAAAGHSARMVQLREPGGPPGERIPAMAVNLPSAFDQGSSASIFQIDAKVTVGDPATAAEDDQEEASAAPNGQHKRAPAKVSPPRTHALQLDQSNLLAVVREAPERMAVDVDLYDINNANRRTITVSLEDNELANKDPDLRARVDPATGNAVRHSPNLAALKQALSPSQLNMFAMRRATIGEASQRLFVAELSNKAVCTVDCLGVARVWLVDDMAIRQAFADWRKLVGKADEGPLKIVVKKNDGSDSDDEDEDGRGKGKGKGKGRGKGKGKGSGEGEGEGDGDGSGEGEGNGDGGGGGGQVGGGGGGSNSGKGKGKTFDQLADLPDPSEAEFQEIQNPGNTDRGREKDEIAEEVEAATAEFKQDEWRKALQAIEMSEDDADKYEKYKDGVRTEIRELRVTLEGLEANETERVWLKNQTTGDLDDSRLIDGLTGERSIYKRRSEASPDSALFQPKPKRLHFVFDLSMSMGRYAADGRLQRSLEAAVMVLEAVKGFEQKFEIRYSGHSGDSDNVELGVEFGHLPRNDKERLSVIRKMNAHVQMCDSGDTTVQAIRKAVDQMARDGRDADARYIFAVSDANLDQYGITTGHFEQLVASAMRANTHLFVLFIASMGDQAKHFEEKLPGKVFTCLDKTSIPKTLKKMFLAAASASKM